MRIRLIIFLVIILVAIEQIIKLIICLNYQDISLEIIPSLIDFKPTLNNKTFYWLGLMNIDFGRWLRLATAIIILIALCLFYLYLKRTLQNKKWLDISFVFGIAGVLCSLSDNIFFGGSWDYVYLKPLFIFDLKDIYMDCFSIFFLICCYRNRTEISNIKMKNIISFLKNELK